MIALHRGLLRINDYERLARIRVEINRAFHTSSHTSELDSRVEPSQEEAGEVAPSSKAPEPPRGKRLRRLVFALLLAPLLLVISLMGLLYVPAVQRWAVDYATRELSQSIGMQVEIDRLLLGFPLRLSVDGLHLIKAPQDTLLSVGHLALDVSPRALISRCFTTPLLESRDLSLLYRDSTATTEVVARVPELSLSHLEVDLERQAVYLSALKTDGAYVRYLSSDTTKTESKPSPAWHIAVDEILLQDTELDLSLVPQQVYSTATLERVLLEGGKLDLEPLDLEVGQVSLQAPSLTYATDSLDGELKHFDPTHIALSSLALSVGDVSYKVDGRLSLNVKSAEVLERSGLAIRLLQGGYRMDSLGFALSELSLRTDHSSLYGQVSAPWSLFEMDSMARVEAMLDATIGMNDLRYATGERLTAEVDHLLEQIDAPSAHIALTRPLSLSLEALGTLQEMRLEHCTLMWEEVMDLTASGMLYDLYSPKQRRGQVDLQVGLQRRANALLAIVSPGVARSYHLPSGLTLDGRLRLSSSHYEAKLSLRDGDATAQGQGVWDMASQRYKGTLDLSRLSLNRYLRRGDLGQVSASLETEGQGLDIWSKRTYALVKGRVHTLEYGEMHLEEMTLDGKLSGGELSLGFNSFNRGLNAIVLMDGLLTREGGLNLAMTLDAEEIDLHALGLTSERMGGRIRFSSELRSDLGEEHQLKVSAEDLQIAFGEDELKPQDLTLLVRTTRDSGHVELHSGDLTLKASSGEGYKSLMSRREEVSHLIAQFVPQVQNSAPMTLRLEHFVHALPEMSLDVEMGKSNALKELLARRRIAVGGLEGHMILSHLSGLQGRLNLRELRQDTLLVDCIDLDLSTKVYPREPLPQRGCKRLYIPSTLDSMVLIASAQIDKRAWRRQPAFTLTGELTATLQEADLALALIDGTRRDSYRLHTQLGWDGTHYRLHIPSETIVLAGQTLSVGAQNFVTLSKRAKRFEADLQLRGKDEASFSLIASSADPTSQEANLIIQRLHLDDYKSIGLPDIGGTLWSDLRYSDMGGQMMISGDLSVQELSYQGKPLGYVSSALFYEPRNDHSHYILLDASYQGRSALTVDGIYYADGRESPLKAGLTLQEFPLEMVNPLMEALDISLEGSASGQLALAGELSSPRLEGDILTSKAAVALNTYATKLRLDTIPLRMDGSRLHFDRYAVYSAADAQRPLRLDGYISLFGNKPMATDLRVYTEETTLFDVPRPTADNQIVYGKLVASADLRLLGLLNALKVRGKLGLLGGTNCTYVMQEERLDASGTTRGLVSYADFADTLFVAKPIVTSDLGGVDLGLSIELEPSVRFGVDLTSDGRDYVRMQGGGNLQLLYPPYGAMSLSGRYEMTRGGTMHYTLPLVGGKLFSIDPSSYVRFDGKVSNPEVFLTATQSVRASAGDEGTTTFLVSIKVRDRVEGMNLSFDLSAPEHLSLQNSLSMMTAEERGKQAIALLATGTYLSSGGGNAFDGALAGFLQSQVNQLTGNLLRGTDLSLGMEMGIGALGDNYTNYTYSFSRRFYNDRLRFTIGGSLQTGNALSSRDKSLIDNIALEYQVDAAGERYLQLYHKRVTDNVLEGEHTETGGGFLLRRRLQRLSDLLRRKRTIQRQDSVSTTTAQEEWRPLWLSMPQKKTTTDSIVSQDSLPTTHSLVEPHDSLL